MGRIWAKYGGDMEFEKKQKISLRRQKRRLEIGNKTIMKSKNEDSGKVAQ